MTPFARIATAIALLALASSAPALAEPNAPAPANAPAQPIHGNLACASDCAVEGEGLEARAERLRTALRLTEAELLVVKGKRHRGRR